MIEEMKPTLFIDIVEQLVQEKLEKAPWLSVWRRPPEKRRTSQSGDRLVIGPVSKTDPQALPQEEFMSIVATPDHCVVISIRPPQGAHGIIGIATSEFLSEQHPGRIAFEAFVDHLTLPVNAPQ